MAPYFPAIFSGGVSRGSTSDSCKEGAAHGEDDVARGAARVSDAVSCSGSRTTLSSRTRLSMSFPYCAPASRIATFWGPRGFLCGAGRGVRGQPRTDWDKHRWVWAWIRWNRRMRREVQQGSKGIHPSTAWATHARTQGPAHQKGWGQSRDDLREVPPCSHSGSSGRGDCNLRLHEGIRC